VKKNKTGNKFYPSLNKPKDDVQLPKKETDQTPQVIHQRMTLAVNVETNAEQDNIFKSSPMLQDLFSPINKLIRLLTLEHLHMAIRDGALTEIHKICQASDRKLASDSLLIVSN
jgi:hypothetical protein